MRPIGLLRLSYIRIHNENYLPDTPCLGSDRVAVLLDPAQAREVMVGAALAHPHPLSIGYCYSTERLAPPYPRTGNGLFQIASLLAALPLLALICPT